MASAAIGATIFYWLIARRNRPGVT